jgi:hypothetical protein
MSEYARIASPLVARSIGRGIALLRWSAFWSAIVLPLVHVPLLIVDGIPPSSPLVLSLWLGNVVALVLGRHHVPHGRTRRPGGERR